MDVTQRSTRSTKMVLATAMAAALVLLAACGDDDVEPVTVNNASPTTSQTAEADEHDVAAEPAAAEPDCPTLRLSAHDSFVVTPGVLDAFTADTCIEVDLIAAGDAGQLVASAILTRDNPTADVLFGIDNTFLQRGLDADLFLPYESPALADVDDALVLDSELRVTPIDYGDVCVNYWVDELPGDVPASLDDLADPANADELVVQNPETSSPGFAFLLATIARYGDGWEDYWRSLVDNGVAVTAGWTDAYYGEFIAGGGDRSIVVSYASSPPAEVIFADPPVDSPPTGVLYDSCFRQVEFAGILNGTEHPEAAQKLIDFMLSPTFQREIPLNMFVYPANSTVELPEEFVDFGSLADDPLTLSPAEIEANRDAWTDRWVEIVLG